MILIVKINSNVKIRLLKIIIVKGRGMSPASFGVKAIFSLRSRDVLLR